MQFRTFLSLIVTMVFLFLSQDAVAQQVLTNSNGDRIIVFPDGSWKYFDDKDPEDIEIYNLQKKAQGIEVDTPVEQTEIQPPNLEDDYLKERVEEVVLDTPSKKKKKKVAKQKKQKPSKRVYTKLQEKSAKEGAIRFAERMAAQETEAIEQEEKALGLRINAEENLEDALVNPSVTEEEIAVLNGKVRLYREMEKNAQSQVKSARKNTEMAQKMIAMSIDKRAKQMKKMGYESAIPKFEQKPSIPDNVVMEEELIKEEHAVEFIDNTIEEEEVMGVEVEEHRSDLETDYVDYEEVYEESEEGYESAPVISQPSSVGNMASKNKFLEFDPKDDVMKNPPSTPCEYSYDDVDEFTGKKRRDLASQTFFVYTSENLKNHFKDRDYLTCKGYISARSGGIRQLNLSFIIGSEYAKNDFGVLEKGSLLTVRFLDGTTIKLVNKKTEVGTVDPVKKEVVYNGVYLISGKDEKKLSKTEVDKVRVVWSTGYEDYEVYEMDFFIDQLRCLNAK